MIEVLLWLWRLVGIPSIIYLILKGGYRVTRHSLSLSGQRILKKALREHRLLTNRPGETIPFTSEDQRGNLGYEYRFFLRNNETVSLTISKLMIVIEDDGEFLESKSAVLYAGCGDFEFEMNGDRKAWQLFDATLDAFDVWIIELETNDRARNIKLLINDSSPDLGPNKLRIRSDQDAVFAGRRTPEAVWAWLVIGSAIVFYVVLTLIAINGVDKKFLSFEQLNALTVWDGMACLTLAILSFVFFRISGRDVTPMIQGYWKASTMRERSKTKSM